MPTPYAKESTPRGGRPVGRHRAECAAGRSAVDEALHLLGVVVSLTWFLGETRSSSARSSAVSWMSAARRFSSIRSSRPVPGIGTMCGPCAPVRSGRESLRAAQRSVGRPVRGRDGGGYGFGREAWEHGPPVVAGERFVGGVAAGHASHASTSAAATGRRRAACASSPPDGGRPPAGSSASGGVRAAAPPWLCDPPDSAWYRAACGTMWAGAAVRRQE